MKVILLLVILLNLSFASAKTNLSFSEVSMKGDACESGTWDSVFSPDHSALSLLFDSFVNEVPNENTQRLDINKDIKVCTIKFSALIPKGYKVNSMNISYDIRGALSLDQGVQAIFESSLLERGGFLNNSKQRVNQRLLYKRWVGQKDDDIFLEKSKAFSDLTKCTTQEEKVSFKIRNTTTLYMHEFHLDRGSIGFMAIDSSDVKGGMNIKMELEKCDNPISNRLSRLEQMCIEKGGRFINSRCILPRGNSQSRSQRTQREYRMRK